MGQYRASIITDSGQQLIADAISGSGTVTFTAIKTSSHVYPEGTNVAGLTDLQDIVQTISPSSVQVFNETMIQVSGRFDNSQVTQAYFIQTLGLYAKLGTEDELLFAVIQADTPDQMPVQSAVSPSAFVFNIQTTVQQANSISVTVNPAGTVTVEDLQNMGDQKVNIVVIPENEDIPVNKRESNTWYLKVTDQQTISGGETITVSPNMGLKILN